MADAFRDLIAKFIPQGKDLISSWQKKDILLPEAPKSTHVISVVNQKGGCGKTTTAVNMSAILAEKGLQVLLIDLDPQAHASLGLSVKVDELDKTIYNVLLSQTSLQEVVLSTNVPCLDIAPANSLLSGAQVDLISMVGRETILNSAIKKLIRHYDYVIIDCSPSLNVLTINALTASRWVLIPFQTHYYSLEGMKELFSTLDIVRDRLNPDIEILGILPTLYDPRTNISKKMLSDTRDYFKDLVFNSIIRLNVKLIEAPMYGKSIIHHDKNSNGACDYMQLADEIISRLNNKMCPNLILERPRYTGELLVGEQKDKL